MKKIDFSQTVTILANIGMIGGILLLAYELRQNNELMAAEARFNRVALVTDVWHFTAEHGDITELREQIRNEEVISGAEHRRVNATVMAVFVVLEWTYRELSEDSREMQQVREVQRYNFANYPEYRTVWETRRDSFHPSFVQWMEDNVINH